MPDHEIYCPGEWRLPGQTHRYREGGGGSTGRWTYTTRSCGRATSTSISWRPRWASTNIANGLKAFGFGAPTGLDIGGEQPRHRAVAARGRRSNFSRREDQVWYPGETVITGIGQGYMLVTPMQLASAAATFAARGTRFAPRLLIGTENAVTREMSWLEPVALPSIEDHTPEHWQFVH